MNPHAEASSARDTPEIYALVPRPACKAADRALDSGAHMRRMGAVRPVSKRGRALKPASAAPVGTRWVADQV